MNHPRDRGDEGGSNTRPQPAITTDDLCEVVITAPDAAWLAEFVHGLIEDRLCAGSHQIDHVRSIYPWRGRIEAATEARVAVRTRKALVPDILRRTLDTHPYEVPSLVALPIIAANPAYAEWVRESTQHHHSDTD